MDLSKIKYSPKGTKKNPYWEYWTDSAVRRGNRKKGYWVRCYGKILKCPVCKKDFFATNGRINKHKFVTCSHKCAGTLKRREGNSNWRGGKYIDHHGYVHIVPPDNHPYRDVRGYVLEHRLVMEAKIKRFLERWEIVHHVNGNRQDNKIENLALYPNTHNQDVVNQLKKEVKRLRNILKDNNIKY